MRFLTPLTRDLHWFTLSYCLFCGLTKNNIITNLLQSFMSSSCDLLATDKIRDRLGLIKRLHWRTASQHTHLGRGSICCVFSYGIILGKLDLHPRFKYSVDCGYLVGAYSRHIHSVSANINSALL